MSGLEKFSSLPSHIAVSGHGPVAGVVHVADDAVAGSPAGTGPQVVPLPSG